MAILNSTSLHGNKTNLPPTLSTLSQLLGTHPPECFVTGRTWCAANLIGNLDVALGDDSVAGGSTFDPSTVESPRSFEGFGASVGLA